jgi:hypothetical protein
MLIPSTSIPHSCHSLFIITTNNHHRPSNFTVFLHFALQLYDYQALSHTHFFLPSVFLRSAPGSNAVYDMDGGEPKRGQRTSAAPSSSPAEEEEEEEEEEIKDEVGSQESEEVLVAATTGPGSGRGGARTSGGGAGKKKPKKQRRL